MKRINIESQLINMLRTANYKLTSLALSVKLNF